MSRNDKTMFRQTGTQDKTRQKSFRFYDIKMSHKDQMQLCLTIA